MKYVATIHFDSLVEPLDDIDWLVMAIREDEVSDIDLHIEPVDEPPCAST